MTVSMRIPKIAKNAEDLTEAVKDLCRLQDEHTMPKISRSTTTVLAVSFYPITKRGFHYIYFAQIVMLVSEQFSTSHSSDFEK